MILTTIDGDVVPPGIRAALLALGEHAIFPDAGNLAHTGETDARRGGRPPG